MCIRDSLIERQALVVKVAQAHADAIAHDHTALGEVGQTPVSYTHLDVYKRQRNPLQRRAGTDTLLATAAAGSGGTTTTLIDASHADAMAWLDWLKPGGNQ